MMIDAQDLAVELAERLAIITIDGGLSDGEAIAYLLSRYPLSTETAAGYSELLNAVNLSSDARSELRAALIPFGNTEKAEPDRETLASYVRAGFTLYAQAETPTGRAFVNWHTGKWGKKDANSEVKSLAELDAALKQGVSLFGFLPSERGLICLDVDVGHASGEDGYKSIERFLGKEGFEANPFNTARAAVSTPSGGCHLYFRDWTRGRRFLAKPLKAVDCFGAGIGKTLTAAGSVKKGRVYELEGDLSHLAPLPLSLLPYLENTKPPYPTAARLDQHTYTPTQKRGFNTMDKSVNNNEAQAVEQGGASASRASEGARAGFRKTYSLEEKVAYYIGKAQAGRNDTAYLIGLRLGARYELAAIVEVCRRESFFADFELAELQRAVASGAARSRTLHK